MLDKLDAQIDFENERFREVTKIIMDATLDPERVVPETIIRVHPDAFKDQVREWYHGCVTNYRGIPVESCH